MSAVSLSTGDKSFDSFDFADFPEEELLSKDELFVPVYSGPVLYPVA